MKSADIPSLVKDPHGGLFVHKTVFVIYYQGARLEAKIKKICESFSANLYPCPEIPNEQTLLLDQVNTRMQEIKLLLEKGHEQRYSLLSTVGKNLTFWVTKVNREKSIYHAMNLFNYDVGRQCLIAEGWCPVAAEETIRHSLRVGRERSGASLPSVFNDVSTAEVPPTYFRTTKLTKSFQEIVNSYGVARYQEINPAVFTIVTFPFEFGIMFGDVGHGFILLIAALFLIYMERFWEGKKINEIFAMVYEGRYLILLMSLFSVYIGALYNECFALPMNFGSNWRYLNEPPYYTFAPGNRTYAFGVDPVWKGATNELGYYNSLKMKTAVTVGIIQMTLGLMLHLLNGLYFRNYYDVFFEFVPRILFLLSTFGYLVFMIFVKWNTNYKGREGEAPVLINELIYMFLPGNPNKKNPLYTGQADVQPFLVMIALVSVPMMLLPKPILILMDHKAKESGYNSFWHMCRGKRHTYHFVPSDDQDNVPLLADDHAINNLDHKHVGGGGHGHDEEFEFSELMVHQGLETIEFVLGCISHTASYLRLWALSLAHSELASVFWEKIMSLVWGFTLTSTGLTGVATFLTFSVWFGATLLVLLGMESLSAFLHALRLHWVEFQSKFYRGDGYPFIPFSYTIQSEE
eukprot:TRINITY_DN3506_c0_g2_i4.p1 TRINITY_DN3506_c0_g2~~TRINITY_DN3506_c0_g2_i4.p1  ORF type:complete len:632 (+),score=105.37 TRINITY_DN3506_c0_g2_i4:783-2678(+)